MHKLRHWPLQGDAGNSSTRTNHCHWSLNWKGPYFENAGCVEESDEEDDDDADVDGDDVDGVGDDELGECKGNEETV